ncbi:MAG: transporter related protein, partial [Thermoleophilia bacterium]|nr:transporter related protein [Thermoleophilia bacterium]
ANELIADVPDVRDKVELLRFATRRLGSKVVDAVDVSVKFGERQLLNQLTWRLGPGDRVALVGANGSGKTTLINVLSGRIKPDSGHVETGATVHIAHLSQDTAEIPGHLRVIEALEAVRKVAKTSDGIELTAGKLAERFGFKGPKSRTLVKDLSGGERRRLQLMRLLLEEPNVLILDEPTNDLDIDTLQALEDLLDSWPGTLITISHDRYFVERVSDNVYALAPGGGLEHLPRGIEDYIDRRRALTEAGGNVAADNRTADTKAGGASAHQLTYAETKAARKELMRVEKRLVKVDDRERELHDEMSAVATEPDKLRVLDAELQALIAEKAELEAAWLEASELIDA